eukprot:TRINITY_DN110382_c0_g1_i1.p1 TRINITY_DN110382_c0_g1~~TRINITY_DN110382_c0_g1_i1.p1  ORF type:complete len:495 (-),score=68.02 TRINITY_DN110382_c0_g1_i1:211-1695(-)
MVAWDEAECEDERIAELIMRIQVYVYPRRIRVKEFFNDFDPLRHGRCSVLNFGRAMNMIGMRITDEEVDVLSEHFTEHGANIIPPQVVNYYKFIEAVDQVFIHGSPAAHVMSSSPSSTTLTTFVARDLEDEEKFMHVLHRLASMCKARGVCWKYIYTDHDRSAIPSPSRQSPYMGGKVTKNQFIRKFPFKKEFAMEDIELLAEKYLTETGDVHFQAMHNDVTEVTSAEPPPFPTSPLFLKPDDSVWSQHSLQAVEKVRAKAVEKRCRLYEHFQDFDPLRKGFCTAGQVKTVFTIMDLSKEIDRHDFEQLVEQFTREDGLFCYKDFCAEVDKEFVTPFLEKDPLAQTSMPDANSTLPARRNKVCLSRERSAQIERLEAKIRSKCKSRRINLLPAFQDMDRVHTGHVTKNCFYRIMFSMGFTMSDEEVNMLGNVYCDLGNHLEFNYQDFLRSVDVPNEDVELAIAQLSAPHQGEGISSYFDARGRVIPCENAPILA